MMMTIQTMAADMQYYLAQDNQADCVVTSMANAHLIFYGDTLEDAAQMREQYKFMHQYIIEAVGANFSGVKYSNIRTLLKHAGFSPVSVECTDTMGMTTLLNQGRFLLGMLYDGAEGHAVRILSVDGDLIQYMDYLAMAEASAPCKKFMPVVYGLKKPEF